MASLKMMADKIAPSGLARFMPLSGRQQLRIADQEHRGNDSEVLGHVVGN
jgi:hypothetical protein